MCPLPDVFKDTETSGLVVNPAPALLHCLPGDTQGFDVQRGGPSQSAQAQEPLGASPPQSQGNNPHEGHFTAKLRKGGFCSGNEFDKWVFLLSLNQVP